MPKLNDIKYFVMGDIHIGHDRNPGKLMVSVLIKWLEGIEDLHEVSMIIIEGDLHDKLLSYGSPCVLHLLTFINWLLKFCSKHDILLINLKGTKSHDRNQGDVFEKLAKQYSCEFMYIRELSIIHIDSLDLNMLMVPDEWRLDSKDTQDEVVKLLEDAHLDQVDITVMHGMFPFQIWVPDTKAYHSEEFYVSITKGLVHIGHIHLRQTYESVPGRGADIIGAGSTDRICFGEMGPKGGVMVDGHRNWRWVDNEYALRFDTLTIDEDIIDYDTFIKEKVKDIPEGSWIQIEGPADHPLWAAYSDIRHTYPQYTWNRKSIKKAKQETEEISLVSYDVPVIDKSNLPEAFKIHLINKGYDEAVITSVTSVMKEFT